MSSGFGNRVQLLRQSADGEFILRQIFVFDKGEPMKLSAGAAAA